MVRTQMHYPGDPVAEVLLMFGGEFLIVVRGGKPGSIRISAIGEGGQPVGETSEVLFDEIVCDSCNAEVQPLDPMALIDQSRAYCWECYNKWTKPYIGEPKK